MLPDFDPASLPAEQIPAVLIQLAGLQTALAVRLMAAPAPAPQTAALDDEMLTTDEAAKLLRRAPSWIYRNAHKLPFVKRLSQRSMLHSKKGVERYLASRKA
jgi:Helix-turn-helix domain